MSRKWDMPQLVHMQISHNSILENHELFVAFREGDPSNILGL